MGSHFNPSVKRNAASLVLGAVGALALAGAAWAGADDGGSKAFYAAPGPGLYQQGPGTTAEPAQSPNPSIQGTPATATLDNGAYQSYRDQPVEPSARPHKRAHKHHESDQ